MRIFFADICQGMASTSLKTDSCSYDEKLRRSVGPGMYMLGTPANDSGAACKRDVPADPFIRYQAWGATACAPGAAVDDGSELRGLRYKASKCSADAYAPGKYAASGVCYAPGNTEARSCTAPTEPTRLSNPPCTLRGTGWNRWEWLCQDPQDRALVPFEWNVSNRIVVKDNHTPILEQPLDQSAFMPNGTQVVTDGNGWAASASAASCGAAAPGNPFETSWRTVEELKHM